MNLSADSSVLINKLFIRHAAVGVIAQLISASGSVGCGIISGIAFGKTGLAVTGLFAPLFFLAGFLGTVFSNGSVTLAAKYVATDDNDRVKQIYTLTLFVSAGCAALLCALMVLLKEPLLNMASDSELLEGAQIYYEPYIVYVFFTIIAYIPMAWARLLGKPHIALILTLTLTITSIVSAVLLIFTLNRGLESLALCQAAATVVALLVAFALLHSRESGLRLKKNTNIRADTKSLLLLGSPQGLSRFYRFIGNMAINVILLTVSDVEAVAAYSVINMIMRFVIAFGNGVSGAQMPIAGVLNEERDLFSAKQLSHITFAFGNVVIFAAAILLFVLRRYAASAFEISQGTEAFNYAITCFCIYMPFYLNGVLMVSWYTATLRIMPANALAFAQDLLFPLLFALLLSKLSTGYAVWLHMPLAGIATVLFLFIILAFFRNANVSIPFLLNTGQRGTALAFSVGCSPDKAAEASEAVGIFCNEQGLEKRQSMLLSLAVEEIITILAQNGGVSENALASVRLLIFDDSIILRLRMGGKKFNPIHFYENNIGRDDVSEELINLLGMKYIVGAAKTVYYTETFGMNNLVIRI